MSYADRQTDHLVREKAWGIAFVGTSEAGGQSKGSRWDERAQLQSIRRVLPVEGCGKHESIFCPFSGSCQDGGAK